MNFHEERGGLSNAEALAVVNADLKSRDLVLMSGGASTYILGYNMEGLRVQVDPMLEKHGFNMDQHRRYRTGERVR